MELKSVTKKENSRAELVIEVSAEQFNKAIDKAYNQNKGSIQIPGFRKGKAPRMIIEGMYGKSVFYEDAINILYPDVFPQAIEEAGLKTVGTPNVEDLDVADNGVLTLTMGVDVYPEVEIADYKGIVAYKPPVEISDEEINAELETLRERNARIVSVNRPAQLGDTTVIDFEGFVDGEAFEGGKGEGYELKLGSGSFIPGFEDALVGVSAGEDKDVEVTFPEDYAEPLAGKAAVFKCTVHEVKEIQKPDLDDEFAIDLGSDSLDELKASTKTKLETSKETESKNVFESNVMKAVNEALKADLPMSMVEEQLDKIIQNFSYQVQMAGMNLQDYLNMIGSDMQSMRFTYGPMAISQVKNELALNKIAELEGVEVSDEEIEAEYTRLAEQYDMEADKVKEFMPNDEIQYSLKLEKASKIVLDSAVVTDKEPEPTEAEKAEIEQVVAQAVEAAAGDEAEKTED